MFLDDYTTDDPKKKRAINRLMGILATTKKLARQVKAERRDDLTTILWFYLNTENDIEIQLHAPSLRKLGIDYEKWKREPLSDEYDQYVCRLNGRKLFTLFNKEASENVETVGD